MGQISPAGFQSLESLYFWYVTIEINDFLNLNLNFEFEFELIVSNIDCVIKAQRPTISRHIQWLVMFIPLVIVTIVWYQLQYKSWK